MVEKNKRLKMTKPNDKNKLVAEFRKELKVNIKHHCDCINHYVSGVDSPFQYLQIADVQEKLCEICDILGIKGE